MSRSVLIVDDHAGFRRMARALLEPDGFDVVGEAGDGETGADLGGPVAPGLVLPDVQLPDLDGLRGPSRRPACPRTIKEKEKYALPSSFNL